MQHITPDICDHLLGLYRYEIANGNTVAAIAASHGFRIAVRFNVQLKVWGTPATGDIPKPVRYWDSGDGPEPEAGFECPEHQHAVIGSTVD